MVTIRPSTERFPTRLGWLDSRHTFSFGHHFHPEHMGFGALRVINDDRVTPGAGFGTHGHRDMEIVSYVVDGAIAHRDSMGHVQTVPAGDVQRMTAGTGVTHSEFNPSPDDALRFLQIWIVPERQGLAPGYEQRSFPLQERRGALRLLLSPDGSEGSLTVHQDARMWGTVLSAGETAALALDIDRRAWVQVVRGAARVNGHDVAEGDGAALVNESEVRLEGVEDAELLVFDLA